MKLTVSHRLVTQFAPSRRRLLQSYRLVPSDCASQKILSWDVSVSDGVIGASFTDGAGDQTGTISTPGEIDELTLTITGEVQTFDTLGVLRDLKEKVPPPAYLTETRFVRPDAAIAALAKEAQIGITDSGSLDSAHALASAVTGALTELRDPAQAPLTASEVLEAKEGNQEDFVHLLIAAAHSIQMPARFVYGYFTGKPKTLETDTGEEETSGPVLSAWLAHSWAELWVEGLGWVGFDPVQECCPDERYIRLCSGRDAADAAPLRGVALGQGSEALEVSLDVQAADQ